MMPWRGGEDVEKLWMKLFSWRSFCTVELVKIVAAIVKPSKKPSAVAVEGDLSRVGLELKQF